MYQTFAPLCYVDWGKIWLQLIFSDLTKNTAPAFFNLQYKFVVSKALQLFFFISSKDFFCQTFYPMLPHENEGGDSVTYMQEMERQKPCIGMTCFQSLMTSDPPLISKKNSVKWKGCSRVVNVVADHDDLLIQ